MNAKYENGTNLYLTNLVTGNEGTYECQGMTERNKSFHGKIMIYIRSELLDNYLC